MKRIAVILHIFLLSLSATAQSLSITAQTGQGTAQTEEDYGQIERAPAQTERATAQVGPSDEIAEGAMSLNDCLLYARQHAHSNRLSRLKTETARMEKRVTASDLMPYVALRSSASLSFGRNIDPETNTYDNKQTLGTGFGIDLSLPLFDGLVRINNLKIARMAELRAQKSSLVEEDKVSLTVIKNFYNVAYCKAMVEQMQRQISRDSTDLAATQRGEELGTKSGADVAELEAVVASDRYELTNQNNLLKKAWLDLRASMGLPLSENPLELESSEFSKDSEVSSKDSEFKDSEFSAFSKNDSLSRKLPEIEEAELALKSSRIALNAARGGYYPRLTLTGGISSSYYRMIGAGTIAESFRRQFRNNMGEYIGLSLSFPLFDGLATTNRVKRAQVAIRESQTRLEETEYQIRKATDEALLDRDAAIEELTAAMTRLEAEQIAYKAIRRKYELGMASAIDLYTAGSKLATAEATLTGKRIQRVISEITLRYYQGIPLISD